MVQHHETEKQELESVQDEPVRNDANTGSPAYVIGASILVAALLVSASVFFNARIIIKKIDGLSSSGIKPAGQQAPPSQKPNTLGPVDIKIKDGTPFLGKADAKVTVVEYADYQCPFCEKWYTSVMKELKTKYIETGKIKFYFQDFAFLGPDSNTAAEATHCAADQNKFWEFHDYLFTNQGQEHSGWANPDKVKAMAKTIGLNTSQFNSCMDSGKYKQAVVDETAAAKTYGVTGTPTVFINGKGIVGAQPLSVFQQAIDEALK